MELVEDFIALVYRSSHSEYSKNVAINTLKKFDKFCQARYNRNILDTISALKKNLLNPYNVLNDFVTYMDNENLKSASIRVFLTYARQYLTYNDIDINPYKSRVRIKLPKLQRDKRYALDHETVAVILNVLPLKLKIFSLMMISTIRRPHELVQLRVADIDFDSFPTMVNIPAFVSKNKTQNLSFLTPECKNMLLQYLGRRSKIPDELIFPRNTTPIRAVQNYAKMMRFYMKRIPELNIRKDSTPNRYKISLYTFKDFAFTRAAKKFDTDFARELKGDRTTQYSNYTIEEKKEMYRELEPELTIFNAEGIRRDLEAKYSTQARELQELKEKEQGKEKEIEVLRQEVGELKVGVDLLKPVLSQLAKEAKTKKFVFKSPEGNQTYMLSTKDISRMIGDGEKK